MKPILKPVLTNHGHQIEVSGDLTVKNAKLLKILLQDVAGPIERLNVEAPSAIDVSGLQLFYAFQRKMAAQGFPVTVSFNLNEKDGLLLQQTGLLPLFNNYSKNL